MLNNTPKNMLNKSTDTSWWRDLLYLGLFFSFIYFVFLGDRPLFTPDEGRYAEIAREMVLNQDYVTPHLNTIKYFEKPILFYWLAAGAIKMGGVSVTAIRSVNAILGILGCLLTYCTARKLYNRTTGILSSLILGTSALYFVMSHMISLDLTVTFFLLGTLYAYILGLQEEPGKNRRAYLYIAAASAGCAVLTKGLIGIVFPAAIIGSWLIATRNWRQFKYLYLPTSVLIFLIITAPWHILVSHRNPEFFYFYFIEQQFLRYTSLDIGHYQPNWFFIPCLIIGFLPWTLFFPMVIKNIKLKNPINLYFIIWAVFIFAFFSFSKSKLIPYILPVFPPLAILTGYAISFISRKKLLVIFILAGISGISFMIALDKINYLKTRSVLPLANIIKPILTEKDDVITYNQYYQDLPFYLERRVSILNWHNELSFGMDHQDTRDWMINDQQFWSRWHGTSRVFVILDKKEFEELIKKYPKIKFYLIDSAKNNVLMSNQRLTP